MYIHVYVHVYVLPNYTACDNPISGALLGNIYIARIHAYIALIQT